MLLEHWFPNFTQPDEKQITKKHFLVHLEYLCIKKEINLKLVYFMLLVD